ncbi:ESPR-type extended signal peptide-containing protein [Winslowiella toletana]|uniref:ESPR-type extended signal peptide-containing protein n=1 Tax=Winslowiella toletana TaxID=92490 RepID=UPI0028BD9A62|nr:ESPR-type extended signal peptide-containing protein [Winslowiella toletana]WNN43782.1 ESPR-type extended signal peptide-containing protein [Winslowiella toletana]
MNKVYKVIWNTLLGIWVVASELAKGKQKSSSQGQGSRAQRKTAKRLANAFMLVGLFAAQPVFAADACEVGTAKELGAALNNNDCTDITLTADINLADYRDGALYSGASNVPGGTGLNNNTTKFDFGTRTAITLDGGAAKYGISNGNNQAYRFAVRGGDADNQVTFTIKNANLTTTAAANNANHFFASVGDSGSNVNVVFDNIQGIPNSTLALMTYGSGANDGVAYRRTSTSYSTSSYGNTLNGYDANYKRGYTYNQNIYSKVTVGTFLGNNASNPFNSVTYKQWINGSKIDFTGTLDFYGTGANNAYSYVFWNNTNDLLQNQLTFKTGSDVSFNLDANTKLTTGDGNGQGYSYAFEDGSSFKLWSKQNVFGSVTGNNVGLEIGSYNKDTKEFGSGAKIIYAGVNGAQLAGDGITNLGGKNYRISNSLYTHSIINNGQYNAGDIIFNLAEGSQFNVTGIGINVLKSQYLNDDLDKATTNINNSGIYIRSATNIDAATGMNIVHDGNGEVVIKNTGALTTTTSGITISSASGNNMNVDMSKGATDSNSGVINATSGTGITAGSSATDKVVLNLTGGEINTSGTASAVTLSNPTNTATHTLNDLIVNLGGSGNMLAKADAVKVALSNVVLNINNRVGLNNLAGINFLSSEKGSNTINVGGTGTGIETTNTAISNLNSEALQINVNGAGVGVATTGGGVDLTDPGLNITVNSPDGTALTIADGGSNTTTIGSNVALNATGATAIKFSGDAAKTFVNQGTVKGTVDFTGDMAHTLTNNGILDGALTAGNGNNSLVLGEGSQSLGTLTFGNGNNNVTINNGALVKSISTGSGNDTFTLNDLTGSNTYLGTIDAGTGTNTLNMNRSQSALQTDTALRGFTNINLSENTDLTLTSQNNITGGTVLLDNSSKLQFGNGYNGNFSATLGHVSDGDGSIIVNNGAAVTLANSGINAFTGGWSVNNGASLTATRGDQIANSSGFALSGVLNLNGLTSLNNALTGAGTLNINAVNQAFNFGSTTGNAFTGNVSLKDTALALSGTNTAALQRATLTSGSGSVVTVGASDQTIGNMTLNGGTTAFDTGNINTSTLSVAQQSAVQVNADGILEGNLLDQDESSTRKIINSTNTLTAGQLALLTLQNAQGDALGNGTQLAISQNGDEVANGTYNYALSGSGGGLTVTAQLIKLALAANRTLVLDTENAAKQFGAQITGSGNLELNAGTGALTLSSQTNNYTGNTAINSGTVVAGENNALGATTGLGTKSGATFNLNGKSQTIDGALANAGQIIVGNSGSLTSGILSNTGVVNIGGGMLTLNNGGSSSAAGGLTGNGNLVVSGGELAVSEANAGLAGNTTINQDAAVTLTDTGTLGSTAVGIASGGTLNLNADQTLANVLSGGGAINTGGKVILSADNTFSGTHTIGKGAELTISKSANLGSEAATVNLSDADSQFVLNGLSGAIRNVLSGTVGSTVALNNAGNATLAGNNVNFRGIYAVNENSTLTIGEANNLGASNASVLLGGTGNALNLARYGGVFNHKVNGTGTLSLTDTSNVTLNNADLLAAGVGINIGDDSELSLVNLNTFNQALSGDGVLNINNNKQSFNFGVDTGSTYAGTVNLTNVLFGLSGNNATALTDSTLNVGDGSTLSVGAGTQTIGNMTLASGTTVFSSGNIATDNLDITDNSVIQVTPGEVMPGNLLDQDEEISRKLINSSNSLSSQELARLTLQNAQGEALGNGALIAITQNDDTVAQGTYNYDLSGIGGGLSVTAQLVKLALATGKTLALDTAGATSKNFSALITGAGNLALNAGSDMLTLNNAGNDYTGSTTINSGTVVAGSNNALGKTSLLSTLAGTAFNLNGKSQTLGGLSNAGQITTGQNGALTSGALANTGTVNIAGGTLTLTNGGSSSAAGGLTGNGNLVVSGGELAVSKANVGLAGNTTINQGAAVTLTDTGTLGSAAVGIASGGTLNLNADQTLANVLSGGGNINTGANVTLSADNTFSGSHSVGADGALTISKAGNLGSEAATVSLSSAGSQLVLNALSGAVNNALSGVAGSTVSLAGGSEAALGGNNSNFLGTYSVGGDSTLSVGSASNLGAGSASVLLGGAGNTLNLAGYSGAFGNQVGGAGLLSLSDSADVTLNSSGNLSSDIGVNIAGGSALTLAGLNAFNQALTGSGALNVNAATGNPAFNFGDNTGNNFAGQVNLSNAQFMLSGNNTASLKSATLDVGGGASVIVGAGAQAVGNLTLDGGTTQFTDGSSITSGTLAVVQDSTIRVTPDDVTTGNLLDQDDGTQRRLIGSSNTLSAEDLAKLTLQDAQGQAIKTGVEVAIDQGDGTAATGTYNYDLSGIGGGLSVTAQLVKLALATGKTLALDTAGATSKNFSALITGAGNLALNAGSDMLTLNNAGNDYTGSTTINSGTVVAGSNNALGNTSLLSTLAGTAFNLNGKSQTLGGLSNAGQLTTGQNGALTSGALANTGTVNIAGGTLTLTNGGSSSAAGGLTGNGSLVVSGGELVVSKANAGLAGNTTINQGAAVTLTDTGTLGSAAVGVASGGTLNLNADQTLANVLSGGGNINTGANVTLSADNTFSGSHSVGADGALTISKAGNLGSDAATVSLSSAGSQLVLNALSGAINNALSGVAGSTVSLTGGSEAALGGNNSNFLGTYSVGGDSTLSVGSANNLGADAGVLLGGAGNTLNLAGYRGAFGNQVGGTGLLSLSDSADVTLNSTGNLASDIGIDIAGGSALTLAGLNAFNQALTGGGALNINGSTGFTFGSNTGDAFAGRVNLSNSQFGLTGNNTASLKSATLDVGGGASVIVGAGAQAVGNLTLDGGTTQFTDGSSITSGTLAVAQDSTIRVTPDDVTTGNLLDQDDGTQRRLIGSSNTLSAEDLAKLTLQDAQGQAIKTGVEVAIDQGDGTAATGTYNYDLSGIGGGLSVTAQLVKLALATGKTLALDTAGATSKNFSALITGAGNLALNAGSDTLTLNNAGNDYTGSTTINSGTVVAGSNNALGKTSLLSTLAGTAFNLNGNTQTLGGLSNAGQITTGQNGALTSGALANTGTVNIAGGTLTLTNGGSSSAAGGLTGNGNLVVSGGELAVSKANAGLAGNTAIGSGGTITLSDSGTLGSAAVGVASGGTLNLNADQTLANVLSGAGAINTGGKVTLSADNTFSGSHSVGADGALTISKAGNLGSEAATVSLSSAGSQLVLNALSGAVNNALSGVAGSTVSLTGGSEAALGGNNSNFLGTYSVGGDSTLSVGSANNLGAGSASVLLGGAGNTLNLAGYSGAFGNQVGGTGLLSLSDSADVTLNSTGNLASDIGIDIAGGSALTLAGLTDFNQLLSGSGAFIVDGNDQSFNFGAGTGSAFSGNIMLNDVTFDIANNSGVLGNATLTLNTGSLSDVGESDTTVGNLNLNGGELAFSVVGPQSAADGTIKTDNLALNSGTIAVNGGNSWENYGPDDLKLMPILAQDYGNVLMTLVDADTLTGKLKDIALKINDVLVVTHDQRISETITQDGETAATAYYNFGLSDSSVADDPGLYVKFSMVGLDLISDGDKGLLIKVEDNRSDLQELRSLLSGSGGLVIEGGDYGLTISNSDNSYSGTTILKNGQLILGDNNVLGNTSQLEVYQGASTLLNGHSQTVETLANSGTVDITDGTLTLTNGGSSSAAGGLTGNGNLVVSGGELAVSKANAGLAGNTTINQGAAVTLTDTGTLGSAAVGIASGGTLNLNADQTLANVLSGGGNINTGANVTLSADNTFSGLHNVGADGALTISKAGNLGSDAATVSLSSAGSQLVLNALSGAINNALSGVAGSTVSLTGGSEAALGGNNSNFLGTYSVGGDSTLSVGSASNLGAGSASVLLNGAGNTLNLAGYSGAFGNQVGGTGLLSLSDSADVTLNSTGNLASDIGVDIADGSALTLAGLNVFNQALTGSGALNVNAATGNQAFNFGDNTGNNFAGQVNLSNAQFMLSGNNTLALTDANLNVGGGTTVSVDVDPQAIGGLTLGGGTTRFTSDGYIESGSLDVTDSSIIQVQNNLSLGDNLLEQSNGESRVLVNSKALSAEELAKLSLQDLDGNSLTNNTEVGVIQSGATVAEGFYNFALSADSGISVVARLVKLALLADKTLELNTANTSEAAKTFTAQITGNGNLALNANSESLRLSNTENDYTGSTLIKSGTLVAGSNNALGNTSQLSALANTLFDLNGKSQSLGALINAGTIKVGADGALTINKDDTTGKTGEFNNTGVVDIGDGTLTLTNGGSSSAAGGLTGNGNLVVSGGELAVSKANAGLAGNTTINQGAAVTLTDTGTLGSAAVGIASGGTLNLNADQTLANVLSGGGNINTGANVTLSADNTFSGLHNVGADGALTISKAGNLGSDAATVSLSSAGSQLVLNALSGAINNALSGVAGSTVSLTGGSEAALGGNNSNFLGTYSVGGDSTLSVGSASNLGAGSASVLLNGAGNTLNLAGYSGAFGNQVGGTGLLSLSDSADVTLNSTGNLASDIGVDIADGSALTLAGLNVFNQALTGSGALNVNAATGNQAFNFGDNTGNNFAGQVNLSNAQFMLSGNNTLALTDANLNVGGGTTVSVDVDPQAIGGLTLGGGTTRFTSDGYIESGSLDVTDSSIIQVQNNLSLGDNLLEQSNGESRVLVNSKALSAEELAKLSLQDLDGNSLTNNTEVGVIQSGATVAEGFYNFALSADSGISVVARLVKLALLADKTLELNTANTSEAAKTFTAQITGNGNLALNANSESLRLSNTENDYTGSTLIKSGTLVAGSNNALGNTSQLSALANTLFDLNGKSQSLGALINAGTIKVGADGALTINKDDTTGKTGEFNNTGVVDIGDGTLTLNNGGASTVAGGLTGNGNLVVSGGELAISQANAGLAGTTLIDEAGTLTLSDSGTLGNAEVAVDGMLNLNVNQTLVNVLRGTGDINTNGNVTLSAESSFKGTHRVNSNGMLTISQAANLGSSEANVALQDASSALVFDALNGELGQSLSGVSGSQINVTKGSGAILTGDNDAFKGTYNVSGESSLTASFTSQLGEEASVLLEAAGDALNLSEYRGDFANQVAGKGTISLTGGSLVAMNSMANIGSDIAMSIDNNSELQLSDVAEFNQALSGNGSLNVNAGNQTFNFGANTGGAFTGSVTLQDSTFNLNQNNVTAVANAALTLGRDSITNVGSTDRSLKDIDVNGGKLAFEVDAPQSKANGIINAETLALNSGDVAVTGDAEWENVGVPAAPGVSILDQDRGEVLMTLVNAGAVTGNVNNINLSINGTPVISGDQAVLSAITQGDKTVANATYSYGLTSNNGDDTGLYIKYGLTALELVTDGTDALLLETGEAGSNQSLNALLSGKGGLNINASNGALTLANGKNSYTGVTTVNQGALLLGADNALGQTSELTIKQGATTSLNGFKQTIGVLDNSGTVSLDNGELVLSNGGQSGSDDGLKGEGAITVAGGDLSISGANDNLKGNTSINSGASITLSDNGNLGSSKVDVDGALNLNAAGLTLGNALSGDGRVNVNAATTLNGNSTFTGEHHVSGDGSLTITQSNNLGADKAGVNLDESGASLVMNGLSGAIRNALSGVQDSVVALTNSANVQLTGNNDGFTGSYALNGNSALTVGSLSQLGKNASISLAGAFDKLVLSGYQGVFSNKVAGNGVLTLADEANVTFGVGYQLDKAVGVNINRNSALTLSGLNRFDHALAGNGALNVTSGGPLFSFGEAAGTAFAGKVDLSGTGLILGNSNTLALTNANLTLSENGLVNVSDGVQKIGGLTLNNGTLKFDNIVDNNGQFVSEGVIEAGSIDVTGGGEVQVNLPANVTPGLEGKSLLELDEGEIIVDLARGDAKGSGQELTLTDANGQPITQSVQAGLTNDGASAPSAVGSFDYGLTTGTRQDGLYVNYGLKAIDLLAKGVDALRLQALEANNALQSNGMSAKISGSGDLAIEGLTDGAILSLSNGNNDYTGATLLRQGGLRLEASNALGLTSELAMSGGTQVDINGTRQTIGQLNAQADSRFNLNGGNVTIKNGGQVDGLLTGAGQLSLSAGTLNVSQANRSFTGNTAISSAASVVLADVTGLGSGNIANKGTLTLNGAQGTFANSLSEAGNLQLQNKATVQLSGNNAQYTGAFTLAEDTTLAANKAEQLGAGRVSNDGKLILDVANDWSLKNLIGGSGDLIKQGSGTLKLLENVVTAGNTIIENGIIQLGEGTVKNQDGQTIYVADTRARARNTQVPVVLNSNVTIQENGALGGFGRVSGNVDNAGRLIMSHALTGDNYADFTVNGNYVGQKGSRIIFDTVLAGDESTTDRLVINGDTSGVSSIKVNNIGGQGAYTNNGIRIIDISGKSGANFELEGRVVAGAYDYKLYQGGVTNPSDGDWYLRTENPDRPEAGSYIANLAAANTMFNTSLENRSGETWYTDAMTGEKKATSMWLRTTGSHNRSRDSSGTFKTQDNRFVTQLGGDVFRFSSNENDLWRVGLMTGYANSSNNTITSGSGSRSKGSAKGYSVGTYGTWFADEKAHTGAYVDSWLQYSWFKNEVNGEGLAQEKYDSKGFTASLETGYTFFAGASEHYNFYLQPKAQAIWMGVKADDHREASNTLVSGEGDGNVQTRLGMKAFLTQPSQEEEAQSQKFKPYIEATWIHNSKDFAAKMSHETTGSHTFKQGGAGNVAEMKLGLEGDLTNRLNMWGNVGQQVGSKGYSDTTVTFGVKYNF